MAADMHARYGRQVRLPEIGEAGQARLLASDVVLGGADDVRSVEAAYVARAGMRVVDDANAEAKARTRSAADGSDKLRVDTLAALGFKDVAVREVGDGALRALLAMRKVLGITEEPPPGAGGGAA